MNDLQQNLAFDRLVLAWVQQPVESLVEANRSCTHSNSFSTLTKTQHVPHSHHTPLPHPSTPPPKNTVSAYVTHGVFPRESWKKFKADAGDGAAAAGGFRYFWLSDSCPQTTEAVRDRQPFEVLTLAGPIAAALQI